MSAPSTRVALIQMACAPSTRRTSTTPRTWSARLPAPAPGSFACLSCFAPSISANARTTPFSRWPSPSPAQHRAPRCHRPRRKDYPDRQSLRASRRGLYHNTVAVLDHASPRPTTSSASTARCISRRSALLREVLLRPGDLGFRAIPTSEGNVGALICWTSGIRGCPPDRANGRQHPLLPDCHRLAPGEKSEFGEAQYSAWQTMQRAHAIANGVLSARSTASATSTATSSSPTRRRHHRDSRRRRPHPASGLEFWAAASSPTLSAASWRRPHPTAKRS